MELVGRPVRKEFQGFGTLSGVVESYDAAAGYFTIQYEDGDSEEVDFGEIGEILREMGEEPPAELTSWSARGQRPKKRRRIGTKSSDSDDACLFGNGSLHEEQGSIFSGNLVGNGDLEVVREAQMVAKRLDFDAKEEFWQGDCGLVQKYASLEDCENEQREEVTQHNCNGEVGFGEDQGAESTSSSPSRDEKHPKKKRGVSARLKYTRDMPLRRSARRANVASELPLCKDELVSDGAVLHDREEEDVVGEVLKPELPPSSNDFDIEGLPVLDVFSVYTCLRSFSRLLFLSPFNMETFVAALRCTFANSLIDSIHFSILHSLKPHLEFLAEEGSQSASDCLRSLNWELLDVVTWPVYLAEYLLIQGSPLSMGHKLTDLKLLNSEYYTQPPEVKLEILRCLCDDVIEVEAIRSEMNRRMVELEIEVDVTNSVIIDKKKKVSTSKVDFRGFSLAKGTFEETADGNSDECCLCRMDGILICCDGCPAAFHSRCVGVAKDLLPEGDWYCPECVIEKNGDLMKLVNPFDGAELLGIDPQGRLYFGSCGYLLVSEDDTVAAYRYYNEKDTASVIKVLNASYASYSTIIKAISNYLEHFVTKPSSNRHVHNEISDINDASNIQMLSEPLSCLGSDSINDGASEKMPASQDNCTLESSKSSQLNHLMPELFIEMAGPPPGPPSGLEPSDEINTTACVQISQKIGCDFSQGSTRPADDIITVKPIHLAVGQKKCIGLPGLGCTSLPNEQKKTEACQLQADPSSYVNSYSFGRLASSVAEILMHKPSESHVKESEWHLEDLKSVQLKAVSNKCNKNIWYSHQKHSVDVEKEKCGWCFSCKASSETNCIFIDDKLFGGPKNRTVCPQSEKHNKSHIFSALHLILSIEDRIRGLLTGSWDSPNHSKAWRKAVLKASDVASLKPHLLILESSLRRVALSADWMKPVDSDHRVGSACHILTSPAHESSNRGGSRKHVKKSNSGVEFDFSSDVAVSGIYWWRGGSLSQQLFWWKVLPRSLASKGGRQAGCRRIQGISYPDGLEFAKRSKCIAWQAAVEMSRSVAQLVYQVKDFVSNIRWMELSNAQFFPQLSKESKKLVKPLKKVIICKKSVQGLQIKYLLDFGKRETIPAIVTRYGIMQEESSDGRKKYWVNESHVPLHLLKSFEEKTLACLSKKKDSGYPCEKEYRCNVRKRKRSEGLTRLFVKEQESEKQLCGHCNKEILVREAVNCQYCNGLFHKKHFRVPKGAITTTYTCTRCKDKSSVKVRVQDPKVTITKKKARHPKTTGVDANAEVIKIGRGKTKAQVPKRAPARTKAKNLRIKLKKGHTYRTRQSDGLLKKDKDKSLQPMSMKGKKISWKRKRKLLESKGDQHQSERGRSKKLDFGTGIQKRKRTIVHLSYWLNGLLWTTKPDDERVRKFMESKVLLPSQSMQVSHMEPLCCVCHEKYSSGAIYISCENCGGWFHGDIFSLTHENINKLIGFKCHKCRKRNIPDCPFVKTRVASRVLSRKNCGSEAEALVFTSANEEGDLDGKEKSSIEIHNESGTGQSQ